MYSLHIFSFTSLNTTKIRNSRQERLWGALSPVCSHFNGMDNANHSACRSVIHGGISLLCGEDIWQPHFHFRLGSLGRWYSSPTPNLQVRGSPSFGCLQLLIQYANSQMRSIPGGRLLQTQFQNAPYCCDKFRNVHCTLHITPYSINVYHRVKSMLIAADKLASCAD
jgi:hypothetical protein